VIDLTLAQMNWELCIAYLDDVLKALKECEEHLDKARENIQELKEEIRIH